MRSRDRSVYDVVTVFAFIAHVHYLSAWRFNGRSVGGALRRTRTASQRILFRSQADQSYASEDGAMLCRSRSRLQVLSALLLLPLVNHWNTDNLGAAKVLSLRSTAVKASVSHRDWLGSPTVNTTRSELVPLGHDLS